MATTREELRRGNDSSAIWSLLTWQAGEEVESESCSDGSDGEEVSVVQALDVAGQSCSCEERVEEGKEEEVSDDADTAEEDNTVMREVQCDEHGEPILVLCKPVEASNGAESFTDPVLCYAYPVQPGDEVTAPPTPKPKRKPKPKTKPKGKPKRKGRSAPWRQRKKGGQKGKPALVPPAGVFLDLQEKQEALKQAAGGDAKAVEQKRRRKRRSRKEIEARMRAEEPVDPAKLQENYEKRCRSRLQRRLRRADEQRESLPAVELTDSRDRGSSWVSMHTGKPPFDTGYGRGNQSPVRGGFIDGEYMTTYNVAPEVAPNKPKTPQLRRSTRHRLHTMNREGRTPALWSRSPHKSKNKSRRPVSSRAYHLPHASWKPGMKVRAPSLLHLNFSSTHPNFDQPAPLAGAGLGGGGTEDAVFVPMVASQPRRAAAASNIQALEEQWSAYNQRRSSLDLADVGWL